MAPGGMPSSPSASPPVHAAALSGEICGFGTPLSCKVDTFEVLGSYTRIKKLFVSAMKTRPLGEMAKPPGSESCAVVLRPSVKPAWPVPATVVMEHVVGSSRLSR